MLDLLIKNGSVYLEGKGFEKVDIGIKDGKIETIIYDGAPVEAKKCVDADGKIVMPGAIDPHTHFGIYNPWDEDFVTESKAAAMGGITSILTYYREKGSYKTIVPDLVKKAESGSLIDFGIHLGILTEQHVNELESYSKDYGISSYKIYTNYMGRVQQIFGAEDALNLDDGDLSRIFKRLASGGLGNITINVHCENMEISRRLAKDLKEHKEDTLAYYEKLSPDFAETESIMSTLYLAKNAGAKVYIVHTSAGSSIDFLEQSPHLLGENTTIETCPHYLTQTVESDAGLLAKVNPPIRYQEDSEKLWNGIDSELITTLGSDHCPLSREKKGEGDLNNVKPGFGGLTLNLPLLLSEGYHKRNISLEKIVRLVSENPAKTFGLYPQKGVIQVGADADIAIVDLEKEKTVKSSGLGSSSDFSIYEGWNVKGWPVITISRGDIIMDNDKIVADSGRGKFLKTK